MQTVLLGAVRTHVPARPAAGQSFCYKWVAASWVEWYMFMFDWSALTTPEGYTGQLTCTFVICILSYILCLLLLYVSISVSTPIPIPYMRQPMILNTLDRWPWCSWPGMARNFKGFTVSPGLRAIYRSGALNCKEAEFWDKIKTKILKSFCPSYSESPLQLCLEISIFSNSRNLLQVK